MGGTADPWQEALERLAPCLEIVFDAYGLSAREAEQVLEDALRMLVAKWPRHPNPERYLMRIILESCHRSRKERGDEDPSA